MSALGFKKDEMSVLVLNLRGGKELPADYVQYSTKIIALLNFNELIAYMLRKKLN